MDTESYFTVRKSRHGYDIVLATPVGSKTLRTVLGRAGDPITAETEARRIAEIRKRPFKRGAAVVNWLESQADQIDG